MALMTAEPDLDTAAWCRPLEAAKRLGVTSKTVLRLADTGAIRTIKLPSGHHRYSYADVEALAKGVA